MKVISGYYMTEHKELTDIQRHIAIDYLFNKKEPVTMDFLRKLLKVNKRTIERDFHMMRQFGAPIIYDRNMKGFSYSKRFSYLQHIREGVIFWVEHTKEQMKEF